jgi:hypothetical protein
LPCTLANTFTNNSGVDVPKATIVKPIIMLEILNFRAIDEAPSTNIPAPFIRATKPTAKSI